MNNLYPRLKNLVLSIILIIYSLPSHAQHWSIKPSGVTTDLLGVWFVSDMQGWAVGASGVILTTTDGGETWAPQVSGVTVTLNDVVFVSPTTGWVVGGSQTILYTNDAGATWTVQNSGSNQVELYSVFFTSPTTGFAAGSNGAPGIIYTTTDAGANWNVSPVTIDRGIQRIFFSSPSHGWVACTRGMLYATVDGGTSWSEQLPQGANVTYDIHGLYMFNDNKGWICGSSNIKIKHTEDGGATWTNQNPNTVAGLLDITFTDSLTGWIVGSANTNGGNHIRYTTDGGVTWTLDTTLFLPTPSMKGVHFMNSSLGWAVGYDGHIVKYDVNASIEEVNSAFNLSVYPNPVTNNLSIRSAKIKQGDQLTIFDITGKSVLSLIIKNEQEIDVSMLESGVYFVRVFSDSGMEFRPEKILKL